jgi:YYY domain-containing protein
MSAASEGAPAPAQPEVRSPAKRNKPRLRHWLRPVLLLAILVIAFGFRVYDLNWDQSRNLHPDERYVAVLTSVITPPASLSEYFNSGDSPFNPINTDWGRSYVYGTLPVFMARYLGEFLDGGCGPDGAAFPRLVGQVLFGAHLRDGECFAGEFTGYTLLTLVGRFLSALADTLTVLVIYLLGRRLFGWRVGLLAAGLSAITVLQIQQAHFFTVDALATLFTTLTLFFSARMVMRTNGSNADAARWYGDGALAGLMAGLAIACKISTWPTVVVLTIAIVIALLRDRRRSGRVVLDAWLALMLAGIFTFAAFRLVQPYAFVGNSVKEFEATIEQCQQLPPGALTSVCKIGAQLPPVIREVFTPSARWINLLNLAQGFVNGTIDAPFAIQWADRMPIVFPLINLVFWGMGIPLAISALIGFFFGVRQLLRGRRWWAYAPIVLWAGAYFLYQSTQWTKSIRYLLPVYPELCIFAALALVTLWRVLGTRPMRAQWPNALGRRWSEIRVAIPLGVMLVVVAGTALWALAFMQIYRGEITRVQASRWMYENVPTALTVSWQDEGNTPRQLQLPVTEVRLSAEPQAFPIRLNQYEDAAGATLNGLQVTLNHIQGAGEVEARLARMSDGETVQTVRQLMGVARPAINFDQAEIDPNEEYFVELALLSGDFLTARTSIVANEHWDDALPQPLEGRDPFGGFYRGLSSSSDGQMQNYNDDTLEKRNELLNWLDEADYIAMSSNRLYGSIPRLPWRYPMTMDYYEAMLGGELGWELVADFNSFPRIGPFIFNTQEMPQTLARSPNTQGTPAGIEMPYPTAEEAFSVYDHPRVLIFRKTPAYSRVLAERILGTQELSRVIRQTPLNSVNAPHGLLLDAKTLAAQQAGGTWSELFPRSSPLNQSQVLAVLALVSLVYALGTAGFMMMALSTRRRDGSPALADGGYAFGKMLGLLGVSFIAWWLGSVRVLPFTPLALWGIIAGVAIFAAVIGHLNRDYILALVKSRWKLMFAGEVVFLVAFVIFLLIRAGNPDLWHPFFGGEKPMDLAFFNTVLKATWFPPQDPWFAGGAINYYYFGFVMVAAPVKALGIDPAVAYNIVIPLLFALTGLGAFGLGASFYASRARESENGRTGERERPTFSPSPLHPFTPSFKLRNAVIAGVLAAVFVIGVGNGDQIRVVSPAFQELGGVNSGTPAPLAFASGVARWVGGATLPLPVWYPYWNPTRPSPEVMIAEFPQFTFLYADLHAHMMAMPLALLALAFALAFAGGVRRWHAILLGAIATGMLWPTNTWDYPPYVLLGVAGLALGALAMRAPGGARASGDAHYTDAHYTDAHDTDMSGMSGEQGASGNARDTDIQASVTSVRAVVKSILSALPAIIVFVALSRLAIVPYLAHYGSAYNSIDPWRGDRTQVNTFITIYGLFLIPLIAHALLALFSSQGEVRRLSRIALIAGLVAGGVLLLLNVPIALLAAPMALLAFAAVFAPRETTQTRLMWLMTAGAWLLTIFVELFVLRGDIERMNTVFKFYIQAWLLLGIASAVALVWVFEILAERQSAVQNPKSKIQNVFRVALVATLAIAFFLAALYPAFAVPAKVNDRFVDTAPRGLDGMAYMQQAVCDGARCTGRDGTRFDLKDDYDAIRWMQDNIQGSPTIMEGNTSGQQYTWSNRYSIYTGLPAVLGWQWHMRQQRGSLDDRPIYDRDADITAFYETADADFARTILERYDVSYVVLGPLERAYYAGLYLPKFDALVENGTLRVAYQNAGVTLYERLR